MKPKEATPLVRFFRRMAEKLFGTWKEGIEPPDRLGDMVITFANMHPHATRQDWVVFATFHAREAYRSGYLRGVEYAEREDDEPGLDPDVLMDAMNGPSWRGRPVGPNLEPPAEDLHDWEWYPTEGPTLEGDVAARVREYEDENHIAWEQLTKMESADQERSKR
jgi:hypothetical protein